ncbi:MAG: GGDEF domain-containing protein [Lachnospiraceae bacterium]|nr:GGDEF domain-containing protein [Lachnospiraceae bacterium]
MYFGLEHQKKSHFPLFLLIFISFLLSTVISLWSLNLMAKDNLREMETLLTARVYDIIGSELSEPIMVSKTMANNYFLIDTLKTEDSLGEAQAVTLMQDYLRNLKNGLGYDSAFVVSDRSRRYYTYDGLNKIVDPEHDEHDIWYSLFLEERKPYDLDVDSDEMNRNQWTVFVNARIEDTDGNYLGVCGVGVQMTNLQKLFGDFEQEYHVKINLVDRNGLVQVDTDEINIENAYLDAGIIDGRENAEYVYTKNGRHEYTVTKYVENLGWYLVVSSSETDRNLGFMKLIGMNVLFCLIVMVVLFISMKVISARTQALDKASHYDSLTGLCNRRSYEETKHRLQKAPLADDLVCITADLNHLKPVNDESGHEAGDELLQAAAACMTECFAQFGTLYRIGGDEFVAILHLTKTQLDTAINKFEECVSAWKGSKITSMSISYGIASRQEFPQENITDLIRISDKRMYEQKEAYYRNTGKGRRRTDSK